ncbi:MAG TPA: NAD(P)/FAD-dependent oxidoreductase [Nocardioides sp.]|nr:NAD(P)/FAD-dependent oxidoreductase [Nocardioides sp.]
MTAEHHDVIVVGARNAGAATAMLLARAGHDVLVLDRSKPTTDTNSTHALSRGGVVQLDKWGLLDKVVASGAPRIRDVSFHLPGETIRHEVRDRAGVDFLLAPRRFVLDDLVAREAVAAGARLDTGARVLGVTRDAAGRATGVTVRGRLGAVRQISARLVIGADGIHSKVASSVGAEIVEEHAPSGACLYTYVSGVEWDGFELYIGDRAFGGVFPTHDGEAAVFMIRPVDEFAGVMGAGRARTAMWLAELRGALPTLAERLRPGRVTGGMRGYVGLPNQVRRAAGPGWALVGDAGYHRDPVTGHGMTDAFRHAELLAEATDAWLSGSTGEAAAMAGYARERDEAIAETFAITRAIGELPEPSRFLELEMQLARALDREAQQLSHPLTYAA